MAIRRLYTVAVMTTTRTGRIDFICGMTVARSDEQVRDIVRMHVSPNKRFDIRAVLQGDSDPRIAGEVAEVLSRYSFEWLDPRPPRERDNASLGELVPRLMTAGHAL